MKCPFCKVDSSKAIFESENFIFLLDKNPIIKGHSLLIPKAHIRTENDITKKHLKEYFSITNKAYKYIVDNFKHFPLTFVNAPQDQSVKHLHKHFIPGVFGPFGVLNALREFLAKKET